MQVTQNWGLNIALISGFADHGIPGVTKFDTFTSGAGTSHHVTRTDFRVTFSSVYRVSSGPET